MTDLATNRPNFLPMKAPLLYLLDAFDVALDHVQTQPRISFASNRRVRGACVWGADGQAQDMDLLYFNCGGLGRWVKDHFKDGLARGRTLNI